MDKNQDFKEAFDYTGKCKTYVEGVVNQFEFKRKLTKQDKTFDSFKFKDMEEHLKMCPCRQVECNKCNIEMNSHELNTHDCQDK